MKRSRESAMAPLDDTLQNDPTFQNLLSSQRQLLMRLKHEKDSQPKQQTPVERRSSSGAEDFGRHDWLLNNSTNAYNGGHSSKNRSDNLLISRRMSIGIGNDNYIFPPGMEHNKINSEDRCTDAFLFDDEDGDDQSKTKLFADDDSLKFKSRRRSTLGFLQYVFGKSDDQQAPTATDSAKQVDSHGEQGDEVQEVCERQDEEAPEESDDDDYGVYIVDVDDDEDDNHGETHLDTISPTERARGHFVVFESSMEKSQGSQQAIHDWDRKMGLKRSHSKTMRLSSRSRKKLRAIMKKEISLLSSYHCS